METEKKFPYPVAVRALEKWANNNLEKGLEDGNSHYVFLYTGSTCTNGGTPFEARLHAVISGGNESPVIEKAWIEIPEDQQGPASGMCAIKGANSEKAGMFFNRLAQPADFSGRDLESVVLEEKSMNFAGCFCNRSHVNQKWQMALSTIHFDLNRT